MCYYLTLLCMKSLYNKYNFLFSTAVLFYLRVCLSFDYKAHILRRGEEAG